MTIGERIKKRRKELHISADFIASKLGVSRSTIFRYEKGDIEKVPTQILEDIASILNTTPAYLMGWKEDISNIYNRLNEQRQQIVYLYAEKQLEEQLIEESINTVNDDKVEYITDYLNQDQHDINIQSELSAGTGILDLDPENVETITYTGKLPTNYDLAFKVSGDSMEPLFEDGEIVFVRKQLEPINGAIMAVQIDEEAFIKKVYVEADRLRFVSLNKKYPDFYADNCNDIRIIGKVVY